ncbi:hypothetical protein R5R35_002742 [Gryllus longicercus]|uniref:Uncharacterized protein n=1 Tax=Gryllus longicercus TaxID=2509291 RepID=A0AAN9VTW7_9ORTH
MPQHRQPLALLSLCYTQVATDLVSTCRLLQLVAQDSTATHALMLARRRLRSRYLANLPGSVRSRLIEEASRLLSAPTPDGSAIGGPAPLYLLALLLAPDIHHLRVELCCYYGCSHQAALLRLLASEGRGLETLELARSALLRLDRSLLHSALISANSLRHLILRNIARDTIMQVIGSACHNLTVLDVSHSRQVTDGGLRHLFLQVELRDKSYEREESPCTSLPSLSQSANSSGSCGNRGWGRLRILLRLFPWLRVNREGDSKVKDTSFLLEYCERRNPLCESLQVLNVANTGVTSAGILLALHHIPRLQSLGEYGHMGRALEILHRAWSATSWQGDEQSPPSFCLTAARSQRTTVQRLELLAMACPSLEKLTISEPHHPPSALELFSSHLTTLHLHSVPNDIQWISGLYTFLATEHGRKLQNFSLRFFPHELTTPVDLGQIVLSCPNLQIFTEDGGDIDWKHDTSKESINLLHLRQIQLGRTVTARALTELLKRAPALEIAHFYSCPDLKDHHIMRVTSSATNLLDQSQRSSFSSLNLQCFYIYEASHITAPAVVSLLASCEQLLSIGNLSNWGLDCEGLRRIHTTVLKHNLNLEINTGSHWFCSHCFPS